MKTYNSAMLQIVSINQNDIIATSGEPQVFDQNFKGGVGDILAPDRSRDSWDAGY